LPFSGRPPRLPWRVSSGLLTHTVHRKLRTSWRGEMVLTL
jgi:hypothetical protein